MTYFVDLVKQYSLREGIYFKTPKIIYIHTEEGLASFGIIWILVLFLLYAFGNIWTYLVWFTLNLALFNPINSHLPFITMIWQYVPV